MISKSIHIAFIILGLCISQMMIFAQTSEYDDILTSSPTLEAVEYVLILEHDTDKVNSFLDNTTQLINASNESSSKKTIRLFYLNILRAFAYSTSESMRGSKKRRAIREILKPNMESYEALIEKHPNYADIYWMASLSFLIDGESSLGGMAAIMSNVNRIIGYLQKAVELAPERFAPRIAYANFDSFAPRIAGGNKKRGYDTIFALFDSEWNKVWQFEYRISRMISAKVNKDEASYEREIKALTRLYPSNWRVPYLINQY